MPSAHVKTEKSWANSNGIKNTELRRNITAQFLDETASSLINKSQLLRQIKIESGPTMDKQIKKIMLITSVAFCLTLSGCGGAENDQPDLGLVKGVVTLEGQPLSGASISFLPDSGRTASARTDANGNYELIYIRDTPGCKLGQNKVIITTLNDNAEDDNALEGDDAVIKVERVKETLPAKYNRKTELVAMVKPGENTFDFKLTKSGK